MHTRKHESGNSQLKIIEAEAPITAKKGEYIGGVLLLSVMLSNAFLF